MLLDHKGDCTLVEQRITVALLSKLSADCYECFSSGAGGLRGGHSHPSNLGLYTQSHRAIVEEMSVVLSLLHCTQDS